MEGRQTTEAADDTHLVDVADGCGCTEVWEHLSEQREGHDERSEEWPSE